MIEIMVVAKVVLPSHLLPRPSGSMPGSVQIKSMLIGKDLKRGPYR
jgi:hypothetical protein